MTFSGKTCFQYITWKNLTQQKLTFDIPIFCAYYCNSNFIKFNIMVLKSARRTEKKKWKEIELIRTVRGHLYSLCKCENEVFRRYCSSLIYNINIFVFLNIVLPRCLQDILRLTAIKVTNMSITPKRLLVPHVVDASTPHHVCRQSLTYLCHCRLVYIL